MANQINMMYIPQKQDYDIESFIMEFTLALSGKCTYIYNSDCYIYSHGFHSGNLNNWNKPIAELDVHWRVLHDCICIIWLLIHMTNIKFVCVCVVTVVVAPFKRVNTFGLFTDFAQSDSHIPPYKVD